MADLLSAFPPEALTRLQELLDETQALIETHGVVLTPDDRQELFKMGDKSEAFVQKAIRYAGDHPELAPGFLDVDEMTADYRTAQTLEAVAEQLAQIASMARDTATAAGSDAQAGALVFYRSVKSAVRAGAPAAEAVFEDLRERFDRSGASGDEPPMPEA